MKFTEEQKAAAKKSQSIEDLIKLAKENHITLTDKEAEETFAVLHRDGILSEDELSNVAGGCGHSYDPEKRPQKVTMGFSHTSVLTLCPYCQIPITDIDYREFEDEGGIYTSHVCYHCDKWFRHYKDPDEWTLG